MDDTCDICCEPGDLARYPSGFGTRILCDVCAVDYGPDPDDD